MSASVWEPGANLVVVDAESTNLSQVFIAILAQTVFALTEFSYTVNTGSIAVYRGGQRLVLGSDWEETSGTSITLLGISLEAGEVIEVVAVLGSASVSATAAQAAAAQAIAAQEAAEASAASIDLASLLTKTGNLSGIASASTARTNLGLDNSANYPTLNQNTTGSATTAANLLGRAQLGSSGSVTNNFTLTAEAANGTMKLARGNAGATIQDILTVDAAGLVTLNQGKQLTLATPQATTSGTSIDFTGIPSWAKRITVMFNRVSTNGTSNYLVQIGSGSIATSGYLGVGDNSGGITRSTAGFPILTGTVWWQASGSMTIEKFEGTTYISNHVLGQTDPTSSYVNRGGGSVTLAGVLDRIRLTTVNGTDTFDAGSVNIMYEG